MQRPFVWNTGLVGMPSEKAMSGKSRSTEELVPAAQSVLIICKGEISRFKENCFGSQWGFLDDMPSSQRAVPCPCDTTGHYQLSYGTRQ